MKENRDWPASWLAFKIRYGGTNQKQLEVYIKNGGFWTKHVPKNARYYKPWNLGYQNWAVETGLYDSPQPYLFSLYVEPMRKFQLAAMGHGNLQPPEHYVNVF